MNARQVASQIIDACRTVIQLLLLISMAILVARSLGVVLPIRTLGHVELAYVAGAYWLTK